MAAINCSINYFFPPSETWTNERSPQIVSNKRKERCECEIFPKLKGRVIHIPSRDVYGHINIADSDRLIRFKMFLLFFWQPIGTLLVGAPLRAVHLCSGRWAWGEGYCKALARWKIERHQCNRNDTPHLAPGRLTLYSYIAQESFSCLSKALIKLATLPIAVFLAMGATWLAIPSPLWARRIFALIEETWSVPIHPRSAPLFNLMMNFRAPCMQPERIWEGHDFYMFFNASNELWSQWRNFKQLIRDSANYLPENTAETWLQELDAFSNQWVSLSNEDSSWEFGDIRKQKIKQFQEFRDELSAFVYDCNVMADARINNPLDPDIGYASSFQAMQKSFKSLLSFPQEPPAGTKTENENQKKE